jgi:hypothetical protein
MVEIKIDNKIYYLFVLLIIVIVLAGLIIAYNPSGTGEPSAMGHSFNEIEMPTCSDGQVLEYSAGSWVCGNKGGISAVGLTNCHEVTATCTVGVTPIIATCPTGEVAKSVSIADPNCDAGSIATTELKITCCKLTTS